MVLDSAQSAQVTNLAGQRNAGRWLTAHHPAPPEIPSCEELVTAHHGHYNSSHINSAEPTRSEPKHTPKSLHLSQEHCMPARAKNKEIV